MKFLPLTPQRWGDFETLFGAHGAYGGCWCMWWRITRREFEAQQGEGNRLAMQAIVNSGEVPGIIGYDGDRPAAWCSVAPRENFASLNRSRVLKAIDTKPVWSLVCLFMAKDHRGQGLMEGVVRGAIDHAAKNGGRIVEAYPAIPKGGRMAPVSVFMGLPAVFERVGFEISARPSKSKLIMRYTIKSENDS